MNEPYDARLLSTGDGQLVAQIIDPDASVLRGATVPVETGRHDGLAVEVMVSGESGNATASVAAVGGEV